MITVFVFSGDRQTQDLLCSRLNEQKGFSAHPASDLDRVETLLRAHITADSFLMDWTPADNEPTRHLLEQVQEINGEEVPVIILAEETAQIGQVGVMGNGLDHYLNKPVSSQKLTSFISDVLRRRTQLNTGSRFSAAGIELICDEHRVLIDGHNVILSPSEYRLLEFFMSNPEKVYNRQQLLNSVWGRKGVGIDERTVDVHIRRLRKVLLGYGRDTLIQTVRGFGYRFSEIP